MRTRFFIVLICFFSVASTVSAQTQKAEEIEAFVGQITCEHYLRAMDNVISHSQSNPTSKIYVFVYEGRIQGNYPNKKLLPQYGLSKVKIRSMKQYLSKRKASPDRFVFVEAGLREDFMVQFWSVLAGASPPLPTPTLKKIRYRKGKPYGFCLDCCGS